VVLGRTGHGPVWHDPVDDSGQHDDPREEDDMRQRDRQDEQGKESEDDRDHPRRHPRMGAAFGICGHFGTSPERV
jgi:hypothetical protein